MKSIKINNDKVKREMTKNLDNLQVLNDSIQDKFGMALNYLFKNLDENKEGEEKEF